MARELAISEKTKVPLGWIFVIIGVFGTLVSVGIPSIVYITGLEAKADTANKLVMQKVEEADAKAYEVGKINEKILDYMQKMDQRLSRIEGRLDISR